MNREYLSFEYWYAEVTGELISYNHITDEEFESIIEDYIKYCEERNLEHDYE